MCTYNCNKSLGDKTLLDKFFAVSKAVGENISSFSFKSADRFLTAVETGWNRLQNGIESLPATRKVHGMAVSVISHSLVTAVKITSKFSKSTSSKLARFSHIPMRQAILQGDAEAIQTLMDNDFELNSSPTDKVTPIQFSAFYRPEMLTLLLSDEGTNKDKYKANPNYFHNNKIDDHPLIKAISTNNIKAVETLFPVTDRVYIDYVMESYLDLFQSDEMLVLFNRLMSEKYKSRVIDKKLIQEYIDKLADFIEKKQAEARAQNKKLLLIHGELHPGIETLLINLAILSLLERFKIKQIALEGNLSLDIGQDIIQIPILHEVQRESLRAFLIRNLKIKESIKYTTLEPDSVGGFVYGIQHPGRVHWMDIARRDKIIAENLQNIQGDCFAMVGQAHLKGIVGNNKDTLRDFLVCPIVSQNEISVINNLSILSNYRILHHDIARIDNRSYMGIKSIHDFKILVAEILGLNNQFMINRERQLEAKKLIDEGNKALREGRMEDYRAMMLRAVNLFQLPNVIEDSSTATATAAAAATSTTIATTAPSPVPAFASDPAAAPLRFSEGALNMMTVASASASQCTDVKNTEEQVQISVIKALHTASPWKGLKD